MATALQILPFEWSYLAEGRANVVWAYRGSNPLFAAKVLRLRKRLRSAAFQLNTEEDPSVIFANRVLSKLLPEENLVQLESVPVSRSVLDEFSAVYDRIKESRYRVDAVDTGRSFAVLAESMLVSTRDGPVLTVEIKPKWGFLPSPKNEALDPRTRDVKLRYCRRCRHKHLRDPYPDLEHWAHRFCPLHLFSKDPYQRSLARATLGWEKSHATASFNNLRYFVNGKLEDKAYNVAAAASQLVNAKFGGDDIDNLLLPALQNGVIWSLLQNYQSDFDPLDIEGVVARVPLDSPLYNEEPSIEEYQAVIHDYVSPFFRFAENDRKLIVAYLLSASFKDCSVFLRFTKDHFSVKVADLDVKSIKKMRHYYELDREIAQNFTKLVEDLAIEQARPDFPERHPFPYSLPTCTSTLQNTDPED